MESFSIKLVSKIVGIFLVAAVLYLFARNYIGNSLAFAFAFVVVVVASYLVRKG